MNMEINPSEYKILIVDDVMSNVLLLKVLLTNEKFAIATASNGRQALEQVEKENPDLVESRSSFIPSFALQLYGVFSNSSRDFSLFIYYVMKVLAFFITDAYNRIKKEAY